ncbi:MAG: nuclear transport factor 2 family protein [Hyphomonas sp.]|uniref:nuclear transport factor 2 family protein n=1 Tax=Hyphomonas sp. TaxID=87 RepID=UPI00182C0D9B|nr:nuclear transport factor 2 family protein [Hyphomonas sp.]MBU3922019.1 nuclear transport factor 2 family protein [Alphaproteobacteria bacterium]MBA3068134.1 nuclear transport factor 2 family protein [Hyphomonas sp.]MBU4061131.1 nuclear transport factor 2 family protein [Alphaproteobacteria bacterium]MBU4162855.1 nuclear transport factor 2 family protein [Alphaproteobacteria bacterium]MBU4567786.1 nuclear transport factor 2 family protein [Alphaproteobacteria bacterium]
MPAIETVQRFTAQVLSGDHAGAICDWYTPDASMQENQAPPRRGRDTLVAQEQATLDRMMRVETQLLAEPLVSGDTVVIRWRFTFYPKGGGERVLEEVAWQTWRGDRIESETFFYDPAQMKA